MAMFYLSNFFKFKQKFVFAFQIFLLLILDFFPTYLLQFFSEDVFLSKKEIRRKEFISAIIYLSQAISNIILKKSEKVSALIW